MVVCTCPVIDSCGIWLGLAQAGEVAVLEKHIDATKATPVLPSVGSTGFGIFGAVSLVRRCVLFMHGVTFTQIWCWPGADARFDAPCPPRFTASFSSLHPRRTC